MRTKSVALFARAWIEMILILDLMRTKSVALFARAWIEMPIAGFSSCSLVSRPLCEGVD